MSQQIPDEVLYDVRLIERHVSKGLLNPKELEKRLGALEDQAAQGDYTNLDEIMRVPNKPAGAANTTLARDRSIN